MHSNSDEKFDFSPEREKVGREKKYRAGVRCSLLSARDFTERASVRVRLANLFWLQADLI